MNSYERIKSAYEHKEADRVPIVDIPWEGTLRRWNKEGMPADVDWRDYFGVDKVADIHVNISPRFEEKIIEETDRYEIVTTSYGATKKRFKELDSTPEFLDYSITDADAWNKAKARMKILDDDRIPWQQLKENYDRWRLEGQWIRANFWFGFDVTHSYLMGTENTLITMLEEPELLTDIFDTYLESCETLFERIWDAGYHFDEIIWYDDMGYKGTTFFSPQTYRELIWPYHKRAVDWAHNRGIYAQLHSCGNIMTLIPDIINTGVDALNPLEIKAGMDPVKIKKEFGEKLTLRGGINAALYHDAGLVVEQIEKLVPILKENGGYMFATDHTIPNSCSLETMKKIVAAAKKYGSFN